MNTFQLHERIEMGLARIETSIDEQHSQLKEDLQTAHSLLLSTDHATEQAYHKWRCSVEQKLSAHRDLDRVLAEIRGLCELWGVAGYPQAPPNQQDLEQTRALGMAMTSFIESCERGSSQLESHRPTLDEALERALSEAHLEPLLLDEYRDQALLFKVVLRHCSRVVDGLI